MPLLRPIHMDTAMCIECASNPVFVFTWIYLKLDVHRAWGGLEAYSNWIVLLIMVHARLRLPWDLWLGYFLGLWHVLYCYFQFCSCSDVGEERGLFSDGGEEWYSKVKVIQSQWFHSATWFRCIPATCRSLQCYMSRTSLRIAFQYCQSGRRSPWRSAPEFRKLAHIHARARSVQGHAATPMLCPKGLIA